MSREIEFRGRHKLDGKWVVGNLIKMFGEWCIQNPDSENDIYTVDPETIGQYTGIKDKQGVKIYEGDVVSALIETNPTPEDPCGASALIDGSVVFADGQFTVGDYYLPFNELYNIEVIGNIHEDKK